MPRKLRSTPTLELLDFTFDICCKSWSCELHHQQEITMFVAKTTCNLSILCICLLHCPTCLGSTQKYVLARKRRQLLGGVPYILASTYVCNYILCIEHIYIYVLLFLNVVGIPDQMVEIHVVLVLLSKLAFLRVSFLRFVLLRMGQRYALTPAFL